MSYSGVRRAMAGDEIVGVVAVGDYIQHGQKLWLWRNGDHYLAFAHEVPTYGGGDPMTLGEPAGVAIFQLSDPPDDTPASGPIEANTPNSKRVTSANR